MFLAESESREPYLLNVGVYGSQEIGQGNHVFHIRGWLANAGEETAYKVKLHVQCDFTTGAQAIDTHIQVGNGVILGRESSEVDIEIPYNNPGNIDLASSSAKITPEWSETP